MTKPNTQLKKNSYKLCPICGGSGWVPSNSPKQKKIEKVQMRDLNSTQYGSLQIVILGHRLAEKINQIIDHLNNEKTNL